MQLQQTLYKRKLLVGSLIAGGLASVVFAQLGSSNVEAVLTSEGLTEQRARELLAASVPVGGIIPYYADLPLATNWRVCDGSIIADAESPLNGRRLPDLRGRFPRGAAAPENVGTPGGSATHIVNDATTTNNGGHNHTVNGHSHALSGYTGFIANHLPSNPVGQIFQAVWGWANQGEIGRAFISTSPHSGGRDVEGQHVHNLSGSTESASASTDSQGAHSHSVNPFTVATMPPFVDIMYIIRIK